MPLHPSQYKTPMCPKFKEVPAYRPLSPSVILKQPGEGGVGHQNWTPISTVLSESGKELP